MMVEMELREIQISEAGNHQIIILGEKEGSRLFPIYIGFFEAAAMDQAVHGIRPPRPMTHDLIYNIIDGLDCQVKRVLVDKLLDDTFHGKLVIETSDGREVLIDSRPSDAIVLACKRSIPIFVAQEVLEQVLSHQEEMSEFEGGPEGESFGGEEDEGQGEGEGEGEGENPF